MVWIEGETMPKMHRHEGFIRDLGIELAVLHSNKEHDNLRMHFNIYETSYISQWSLIKFLKYMKPDNNNHIINKPQLCTICQDTINKSEENFKCAHCDYQFHVECISKWLDCKHSHLQCPNCRQFFFYKSPIY